MKEIPVSNSFAKVSEEDWELVSKFSWYLSHGYAIAFDKGTSFSMHKLIMRFPINEVDHINNDRLDNQRSNLRLATSSQNKANSIRRITATQKYRGVYPSGKKWRAALVVNYKYTHLGTFLTEEEAAQAYDLKAREVFGEFATTNFSNEQLY